MQRQFAIGDIHGCSTTFKKLILDVLKIEKSDILYCVGDYIDRGPDSKGVVDFILELRKGGLEINTVRGNHEQMLLDSVRDKNRFLLWMMNGGDKTLKSFGVASVEEMSEPYRDFFDSCNSYYLTEKYIITHAGLNPDIENPLDDTYSMLWIRGFEYNSAKVNGKILIHGHTPLSLYYIEKQGEQEAINIDGGCVYKLWGRYGHLVAYDMNDARFISVDYCD